MNSLVFSNTLSRRLLPPNSERRLSFALMSLTAAIAVVISILTVENSRRRARAWSAVKLTGSIRTAWISSEATLMPRFHFAKARYPSNENGVAGAGKPRNCVQVGEDFHFSLSPVSLTIFSSCSSRFWPGILRLVRWSALCSPTALRHRPWKMRYHASPSRRVRMACLISPSCGKVST